MYNEDNRERSRRRERGFFMKKILNRFGFLILMGMLILAGCGGPTQNKSKITILQNKVEIQGAFEEIADKYNAQSDKYEVEILGTNADYVPLLQTSLMGKDAPVIFSANGISEVQSFKEHMEDIASYKAVEYAVNDTLTPFKEDDMLIGLPSSIEGFGFVYNKPLFKKLGINPEEMKTIEGFNQACDKLKAAEYECVSIAPEGYFISAHLLNVPFALQADYQKFIKELESGQIKLDTPEFKEWSTLMTKLKDTGGDVLSSSYDKSANSFATEKAAMLHQGNWVYPLLKENNVTFEMGYLPMPIKGNDKLSIGVAQSLHVNKKATKEQKEGADDFLNWMYSNEESQGIIIEKFGVIPPFTNFDTTKLDPLSQEILKYTNDKKTLPWTFNYFPTGKIDTDMKPIMEEFFANKITADQALQKIEKVFQ